MNWARIGVTLLIAATGLPEFTQAQGFVNGKDLEIARRGQTRYIRTLDGTYAELPPGDRGYHIATNCGLKAGPTGPRWQWDNATEGPGGTFRGRIESEDECHAAMGHQSPAPARAGQILRGNSGDWNFFIDKQGFKRAIHSSSPLWKECPIGQIKSQMEAFDTIFRISSGRELDKAACLAIFAAAEEIAKIRAGAERFHAQTVAQFASAEKFGAISPEEKAKVDAQFAKIADALKTADGFAARKQENDELAALKAYQDHVNAARALVTQVANDAQALASCRANNLRTYDNAKAAYTAGVSSKKIKPIEAATIAVKEQAILRLKPDQGGKDMAQCSNYARGIDAYAAAVTKAAAN
ncbi:MAG: hypothetical protein JNJ55_11305 [Betaproteobacteria bacterium]|nr:hypothetical protein [Betaproteobacteria bacterium]